MERLYPQLILDALKNVRYPASGKNIVDAGMVEDDIRIDGNKVSFSLVFDKPTDPFIKSLVKASEAAIATYVSPEVDIKGNIAVKTRQEAPQPAVRPLAQVKNIVGISSGKGGVGKSTVASNLAVALAREGYKVGLLDADIFGPSMPKMFGVEDAELYMHHVDGRELIIPHERYGVKLLSIGFLVDKNAPVLWRGSMASNALRQLICDADWGELDYFLIDMPPGTSDIHLTLVQTLPLTGVVIVSTPQQVALADARKGIAMFTGEKVNVPILGLVEIWPGSLRRSIPASAIISSAKRVVLSWPRSLESSSWRRFRWWPMCAATVMPAPLLRLAIPSWLMSSPIWPMRLLTRSMSATTLCPRPARSMLPRSEQ